MDMWSIACCIMLMLLVACCLLHTAYYVLFSAYCLSPRQAGQWYMSANFMRRSLNLSCPFCIIYVGTCSSLTNWHAGHHDECTDCHHGRCVGLCSQEHMLLPVLKLNSLLNCPNSVAQTRLIECKTPRRRASS